ncbi:hypothetical protein M885DRAFT_520776 [Pelagophyceae sp. CCMP2097]|nr:hypothetical protein M885DRAFT_520776 [Pelagophyceae sp. CCMP2097]
MRCRLWRRVCACVAFAAVRAERRAALRLHGVGFAAARRAILDGGYHDANNYKNIIRAAGTVAFDHPRGGPTVETVVTLTEAGCLRVDVTARSPCVPFGGDFTTVVSVRLDGVDDAETPVLEVCCTVAWRNGRRPLGFLAAQVEDAAERGAVAAWCKFCDVLISDAALAYGRLSLAAAAPPAGHGARPRGQLSAATGPRAATTPAPTTPLAPTPPAPATPLARAAAAALSALLWVLGHLAAWFSTRPGATLPDGPR